jgi:hypothetical protein
MRGKGGPAIGRSENRICAFEKNRRATQTCGLTRAINLAARQGAKGRLKLPLMRGQHTGRGAGCQLVWRDQMQRICIQHQGNIRRKGALEQRAGGVASAKARPDDNCPSSGIGQSRIDRSVHNR